MSLRGKVIALALLVAFAVAGTEPVAASGVKHYLYLATPDGAQPGGSGNGLLVFDVDAGHAFVRRIDVPACAEGVRGVCASAATGRLFIATSAKHVLCLDLNADRVVWEKTYDTGCDRLAVTPDGTHLYIPSGWWNKDKCWLVVDAADGREISRIAVPAAAHNTLVSLDGTRAFLASNSWLSVIDTKTNATLRDIRSQSQNFFPFTISGDGSKAYVCLGREIGFETMDAVAGKVVATTYVDGPRVPHRTHGIGLTPDEKEIWLSDQEANAVYVFDNTGPTPRQTAKLPLSKGGHGWIGFSLDGRFAYASSPEVFDAASKKVVATLKDEKGKEVCGSKYLEVDFKDGKVIATGDQFGVGRVREKK